MAIRQTLWRIVFFYVLGALVLGMSVPYTNDLLISGTKKSTGAAASPLVIAVQLADTPVFPHVVNGCLLIFVISAAGSDIYNWVPHALWTGPGWPRTQDIQQDLRKGRSALWGCFR